jgi:ribosomal peptide maturation radical SAM protein 1
VLEHRYRDKVSVDVIYLTFDFAQYLGVEFYNEVADSFDNHTKGLGDWFFRQAAFPDARDNTEEYFKRYYSYPNEYNRLLRELVKEKRPGLDDFLGQLIEKYHLDNVQLAGFTSTFAQNVACISMARKLKEQNPNLITVMGGANCEAVMGREIAAQVEAIDFVFSGPALKSFRDFVGNFIDGELEKCSRISGVFSKSRNESPLSLIRIDKSSREAETGDELSIDTRIELDYEPFLEALETNFPDKTITPKLLFETSRGCWWGEKSHCTFCGLNGNSMQYRTMSPQHIIDQFHSLFKYFPRCSEFDCVDNIMPKHFPKEVAPFIDVPPKTVIFYEVKADLNEEEIKALSNANVNLIQPGIESLATSTLKLMKKGTTAFQNIIFLKHCATYGVQPIWNILVGFPGEEEEVYRKYLRDILLLAHLFPPSGAFPVRFDRFSPYHTNAAEYGLHLQPVDFYSLTYPFSKESLANLAYYFMDYNFNAEYFTTMVKWIGEIQARLNVWQARWLDPEGATQPQLYFKGTGEMPVIYDSRGETVVEHRLRPVSKKVLECLDKPRNMAWLAKELSGLPDFNLEEEIAFLQERGLLFQEGERFLNLAHPKAPPLTKVIR